MPAVEDALENASATGAGLHLVVHEPEACELCDLYHEAQAIVLRIESGTSLGTGVLVAPDGRLVTNAHVVPGDGEVFAVTFDGERLPAERLEVDTEEDLALLRIRAVPSRSWAIVPIEVGEPRVGGDVYAIGHPLGLGWTVTRGIVSALRSV
ncbi:MAG: trypsin-like peptidase domain-containing protein [Planctomycetota bacterium]